MFAAKAQQVPFTIYGSFKNMTDIPSKVYLIYAPFLHKPTDSAMVQNGKYQITGITEKAVGAQLSLNNPPDFKDAKSIAQLILDKGELNIVSDGSFNQITVTGNGSKTQNEYDSILTENRKLSVEVNKEMTSDSFKTDAAFKQATMQKFYHLLSSSLESLIVYVRKNPNSEIAPYLTYTLVSTGYVTPAMQDTLAQNIPAPARQTILAKQIDSLVAKNKERAKAIAEAKEAQQKAAEEKVPVGIKAPDFTENDVNGNPVSLSSFKGKYVLVDFWASWCAPCRAENPNVVKAYNEYKDKGFNILGVSLDGTSTKNAWLAAIKKDGLTWTEVSDLKGWENAAAQLYMVTAIPQNFLIDPNGVIIAKNLRGDALESKLAEIFKK
ncbi:hypothetical protein A9P82_01070 [Arachidicoccus ginsenosidimutans]|nr:hypothetical protein A9P82_01070 [Arachidicoccus sp. BS20]